MGVGLWQMGSVWWCRVAACICSMLIELGCPLAAVRQTAHNFSLRAMGEVRSDLCKRDRLAVDTHCCLCCATKTLVAQQTVCCHHGRIMVWHLSLACKSVVKHCSTTELLQGCSWLCTCAFFVTLLAASYLAVPCFGLHLALSSFALPSLCFVWQNMARRVSTCIVSAALAANVCGLPFSKLLLLLGVFFMVVVAWSPCMESLHGGNTAQLLAACLAALLLLLWALSGHVCQQQKLHALRVGLQLFPEASGCMEFLHRGNTAHVVFSCLSPTRRRLIFLPCFGQSAWHVFLQQGVDALWVGL